MGFCNNNNNKDKTPFPVGCLMILFLDTVATRLLKTVQGAIIKTTANMADGSGQKRVREEDTKAHFNGLDYY